MKIRYTRPALADLALILDYVASHSPQGAVRVQARIQAVIDLLVIHPDIGVRTTLPYPYLVFYEVRETDIIVHAVRHSARDPSDMPGSGAR